MHRNLRNKILINARLGNGLEYFDFSLYAFLSPVFGRLFFDAENYFNAVIYGYATFALSFLVRPLGGIIWGIIGSKKGIGFVLNSTVLLMAISTISLAFLPTYTTIGGLAAIFLLLLRSLQCLSLSGEYVASLIMTTEMTLPEKRDRSIGNIVSVGTIGWLLGSIMSHFVLSLMQQYPEYDYYIWRIPFIIGAACSLGLYYFRSRLFLLAQKELPIIDMSYQLSIKDILHNIKFCVITVIFAGWNGVLFYGLFLYPPVHLSIIELNSGLFSISYTISCILFYAVTLAILGIVMSKIRYDIKRSLLFLVPIIIWVLYVMLSYTDLVWSIVASIIAAIMVAFVMIFTNSLIPYFFERKTRFKNMSIFYNIGIALFGGTAPIFCTYLQGVGENYWPYLYIILFSILSIMLVFVIPKKNIGV